jgi:hypothetical protein
MYTLHRSMVLSVAVLATMLAANVHAQAAPDQGKMDGMKMDQTAARMEMTEAAVRKVDF